MNLLTHLCDCFFFFLKNISLCLNYRIMSVMTVKYAPFKSSFLQFSACMNYQITEPPLHGWLNMMEVYFSFWKIWMWTAYCWSIILSSHMEPSLLPDFHLPVLVFGPQSHGPRIIFSHHLSVRLAINFPRTQKKIKIWDSLKKIEKIYC